ncbi:MAG: porin family protein [Pseudomonadota bacterium]
MRTCCFVCAIALMTASGANAQSMWEGAYAGGSFAFFSGENSYDDANSSDFDLEGQMFGAFAGYHIPTDLFMVGAEISLLTGTANEEDFEGQYEYTSLVDLKARIGLPSGDFMPYGILGASFATFAVDEDGRPDRNFDETETGILFGIGADYAINREISVGAEFISRSFDFEFPETADLADVEGTVNSFALRGTYRF